MSFLGQIIFEMYTQIDSLLALVRNIGMIMDLGLQNPPKKEVSLILKACQKKNQEFW